MLHTLRDSGHWICATHCCCPLPIIQITECVGWKLKGHLLAKISYSIVLQNKDNSASGLFYNRCTFAKATSRFRGNGNLNVAFAKNGENISTHGPHRAVCLSDETTPSPLIKDNSIGRYRRRKYSFKVCAMLSK